MSDQEKWPDFAAARNQVMAARAERARHLSAAIARGVQWMIERGKRLAAAVKFNA